MPYTIHIDQDIHKAETLPGWFYHDNGVFDDLKEKVFVKTWQWVGDANLVALPEMVYPFQLLEGFLQEPMLLVRDQQDQISCLSNVCTHRGNMIVQHAGKQKGLTCLYHGRKFDLNGAFKFMPEFAQTENFPRPCDSLHNFPVKRWGPFLFSSIEPDFDFQEVIDIMHKRVGFLPLEEFMHHPTLSKDYLVNAHWALYCDNYLEGFHIPFVHPDLNNILDYKLYRTEIYPYCNLQIGFAREGEEVFDLPPDHVDYGKNIGAYYFWVYPNMMFNFYPWGLSINIVKPITKDRSKVSFITYVFDDEKLHSGAGAMLDKVEREDEYVVENVHRGLRSRVYTTGRFSPTREQGTHHFHRLLATYLMK